MMYYNKWATYYIIFGIKTYYHISSTFHESSQRYTVICNINPIPVLFLKPSGRAIYYHVRNMLEEMLQRKC